MQMTDQNAIEPWRLKQMMSIPLEQKVLRSARKIREFVNGVDGMAYVSWSGGLDSRVMLDLVRNVCQIDGNRVPAVFLDTGLEYPEVRECAERHAQVILKPKLSFRQVLDKVGCPVISKKISQYVSEVQSAYRHGNRKSKTVVLRLTGMTSKGTFSPLSKISKKWQYLCDAPFRCSDKCCDYLKKFPAKEYDESSKRFPMIGMRVEDSRNREQTFLFNRQGRCNVMTPITIDRFHYSSISSWPLAIWTNRDIVNYVRSKKLDHPDLYDKGATGTGCYACMFGIHMEKPENRFQRMYRDHPKLWKACMDGFGCREVMKYLKLPVQPIGFDLYRHMYKPIFEEEKEA